MNTSSHLFQPYPLNATHQLKNRVVMAPMSRFQANADGTATQAMADYYARRADAGLIVTEATIISPNGVGYKNSPGIYTHEQITAWQHVTNKVHENGGKIFLQIWHVGRVSHPHFLNGQLPLSSSKTIMKERIHRSNNLYYGASRAATLNEIKQLIQDYKQAAINAMAAGFDGVEIHGANGYLIDQFLHYHTNHRTDEYGSTPENMARFALEIVKAIGDAIGYDNVGLRLSPGGYVNEIVGHACDSLVFQYLLEQLNQLPIAYLHTGNFDDKVKFAELQDQTMTDFLRSHYHGILIASGSYSMSEANEDIINNKYDLIAIGRPFIANPDLITRFKNNSELNSYNSGMLQLYY